MPLDFGNSALERIDLPTPGEWVEVKRALGVNERRAIRNRLASSFRITVAGEMGDVDAGAAIDLATFSTMEIAIKRWSFAEPVTAANLRALDDESVAAITARLNELYPEPRSDDEAKNSSPSSPTPLRTADPTPLSSAGGQ